MKDFQIKNPRQRVVLVRHGETEWSLSGRHTSVTDIPLTQVGERRASALEPLLRKWNFGLVLCSPRLRAKQTCDLLRWGKSAVPIEDLVEWNYGEFEGLTTPQIRERIPGWTVFTNPCPNGETAEQVAPRVDRVIAHVREFAGDTLLVGHSHCLRVLAARWLGLDANSARFFNLETGTWSVLSYEHESPVIQVWSAPPE
ncbi:MAG: histidine phosphatase family protein [Spartobacteria bacterium]